MSLLVVVSGSRGMQVVFQHPGYPQPQGQTPHEQEAATTPLSEGADKRVGGDEGPRTTSEPVDRVHGLQASAVAGLVCVFLFVCVLPCCSCDFWVLFVFLCMCVCVCVCVCESVSVSVPVRLYFAVYM